jgi:hypothetical protein
MTVSDDEIFQGVADLPRHDVDAGSAERIRAVALEEFRAGHAEVPAARGAAGFWTRFVEPALVVVSVVTYLAWTASTLTALHTASSAGLSFVDRGKSE